MTRLNFSLPIIPEVDSQYILQVAAKEVSKCPLIDLIPLMTIHQSWNQLITLGVDFLDTH